MPIELNPAFPVVDGTFRLTGAWTLELPAPCNRRIEDGDLVLWRPGLTAWIAIWKNDDAASIDVRLGWTKDDRSLDAYDVLERDENGVRYFSYRLNETDAADARVPALYGYAYVDSEHVQLAIYFDDEADAGVAEAMFASLRYAKPD